MTEIFIGDPVTRADPDGASGEEFREAERERVQLAAEHYRAACEEAEAGLAEARAELAFVREQVARAAEAERERIRSGAGDLKFTFFRPGDGLGQTHALDVVPLEALLGLLGNGDGDD